MAKCSIGKSLGFLWINGDAILAPFSLMFIPCSWGGACGVDVAHSSSCMNPHEMLFRSVLAFQILGDGDKLKLQGGMDV